MTPTSRQARRITLGMLLLAPTAQASDFDGSGVSSTLVGHAYLIQQQGDPMRAAAMLMAAAQQQRLGRDSSAGQQLIAASLARLGLKEAAAQTYADIAGDDNLTPRERDHARLERAKLAFELGHGDAALASLSGIERGLNAAQARERDTIRTALLLQQGKLQSAIAALPSVGNESSWALYRLFNIGVTLMDQHRDKNGALLLHRIGRLDDRGDAEIGAIRDQANLALGYSLLQINQPGKARDYLERVRLDSHLSDIALLGMGWSYASDEDYQQALVFWMELNQRPRRSAYGYESLLAIPYALGKAGAYRQALERFEAAKTRIEADMQQMNDAKRTIAGPRFPDLINALPEQESGWLSHWQQTPGAPPAHLLPLLLDNPAFQVALHDYRTLLRLAQQLDHMRDELVALGAAAAADHDRALAGLGQRQQRIARQVEAARSRHLEQLRTLAITTLERYQAQLDGYSNQIKFGIAQAIEGGTFRREEGL